MRLQMKIMTFLLASALALTPQILFALSAAVKSQNDYVASLDNLRDLRIIIENFGTEDQKKKFEEIRALFKQSAERHYAQEFIRPDTLTEDAKPDNNAQSSTELFTKLKVQISQLQDDIAKNYIERSQAILDSTAKESNDILLEYGKNTGLSKYFYRPIDPLTEKKPYNTEKYHFFKDKEALEHYLKNGYRSLQDARTLYNDADYSYIKTKQTQTSDDLNYLLYKQQGIIKHCRQAKQYGIEIHKILKESSLDAIQKKYNITLGTITKNPLYDDRIPEEYKVDAIDNQRQAFKIEKERIGYTAAAGSSPQEKKP
jgi:hypothetical protein